jgi:predicted phage tail protein
MNEINSKAVNIDKISVIESEIHLKKSQQKGDGSFDKILTNQLDKSSKDSSTINETSLQEIQGTFKAQKFNVDFDTTQFAQQLDSSLNMLELYAAILQDPDKTLKQAWDILEQLTNDTKTLEQEFKGNDLLNQELDNILTQLLTTVEVENIKFNRGDYT